MLERYHEDEGSIYDDGLISALWRWSLSTVKLTLS